MDLHALSADKIKPANLSDFVLTRQNWQDFVRAFGLDAVVYSGLEPMNHHAMLDLIRDTFQEPRFSDIQFLALEMDGKSGEAAPVRAKSLAEMNLQRSLRNGYLIDVQHVIRSVIPSQPIDL